MLRLLIGLSIGLALHEAAGSLTSAFEVVLGSPTFDSEGRVMPTLDGGLFLGGISKVASAHDDLMLARLNSRGDVEWARSIEGSIGDNAHGVATTPEGGCLLLGVFTYLGSSPELGLFKFNGDGSL